MMKMKIKKLSSTATTPTQATVGSAGFDLYADLGEDCDGVIIKPQTTELINTGFAMALEPNYVGLIFARSGLATKKGLRLANSVGVIDTDYRGEVKVAIHNDSFKDQIIKSGDRIAQLVIVPYASPTIEVADDLDDTERGAGGFGSSGK